MITFKPNSSAYDEIDALATSAEDIIWALMNIIEKNLPEIHSQSNEIMCANDWLKWKNGEAMDNEIAKIVEEINDFCK